MAYYLWGTNDKTTAAYPSDDRFVSGIQHVESGHSRLYLQWHGMVMMITVRGMFICSSRNIDCIYTKILYNHYILRKFHKPVKTDKKATRACWSKWFRRFPCGAAFASTSETNDATLREIDGMRCSSGDQGSNPKRFCTGDSPLNCIALKLWAFMI